MVILLSVLLLIAGLRFVFPPYYNIGKMKPVEEFNGTELFQEFVSDPIDAQSRYSLQPILVEGRVTGLDNHMIIMGSGMEIVRIKLLENWRYEIPVFEPGNTVIVKGICRGIDLNEVLVSNAIIISVRK